MLNTLHISNYLLIRSLDITFDRGFAVITGETGAGKSILMGALGLLLGNRADTDVLFDKQKKCVVEAQFDVSNLPLQPFFEENDIDYHDETIIRREINEHSKSRAFINDTPVNLTVLKALSSRLIDIHSQHQTLMLNDADFRLGIFDQYAQNGQLRRQYQSLFTEWRKVEKQREELRQRCAAKAMQQEFNQFTVKELEEAQLQAGEQEAIERQMRLLANAEDIKTRLYAAAQLLSEQEGSVVQLLKSVQSETAHLPAVYPEFQELQQRIDAAVIEIKDVAFEVSRMENDVEADPKALEQLGERLDRLNDLQYKYKVQDVASLIALKEQLQDDLSHYSDDEDTLRQLDDHARKVYGEVGELARKLSESRQQVMPLMEEEVRSRLQILGMTDSIFQVSLAQVAEPTAYGIDKANFLFSANKGVPVDDISKVASGGEMSRLMLALKSVITESVLLPTIIFDEIDTGISGEMALKVSHVMAALSQRHQVIAITHLPQIAAAAHQHYNVFKETRDGQAVTNIRLLSSEEHEREVASMLSGKKLTDAALATARELIQTQLNM